MWPFNYTVMLLLNPVTYLYMDKENSNQDLIVDTNYGQVLGTTDISRNGREFFSFLGIPYAKPPIGNLRYASPEPVEPWTKVRDATSFGSKCSQIHLLTRLEFGTEDCLYLNIYTHQIKKANQTTEKLELHPVFFYLHGGGFMGGSGNNYGPTYLMDRDVVFVAINYRLASFGFLNAGHEDAQGNMGLKDQVMALKWVKENIANFGGDPNKVAIVGQSAGGVCAHFHMLSPMSKGLFHRVITQSGTALAPWGTISKPIEQALNFAAKVNCSNPNVKEMIECLRGLNSSVLLKVHSDSLHFIHESLALFKPSLELVQNDNTFITESPFRLLAQGKFAQVPFMTGVNSHEGIIFSAMLIKNKTINEIINTNWVQRAPQLFGYEHEPEITRNHISTKIKDEYLKDQLVSMSTIENVTNMITDRNWFQNVHNIAMTYRQNGIKAPLYLYYFTYHAEFSLGKVMFGMSMDLPVIADIVVSSGREWLTSRFMQKPEVHYGAGHTDEMFLLYKLPFRPEHGNGSKDYEMSNQMVDLWVSFVKEGKPLNATGKEEWLPANDATRSGRDWLSYFLRRQTLQKEALKYFVLDKKLELIEEPFSIRVNFWNSLGISDPLKS